MLIKINIQTSSQKLINIIENQILRLENNTTPQYQTPTPKYIYYTCKWDFIEHLFDIAKIVSNTNTIMNYEYNSDSIIQSVNIISWTRPKYSKSFEIHDDYFTY
jgi:hypothetical protein